ncbi:MAG: IS110 family transposase [Firmicutes bacterium]|nr:IS110 family transposase [Bacillota bacterium]
MKVKYEYRLKQKLLAITTDTLVVGVDIAKTYQWARFVDFRGIEYDHALKFKNSKGGFETILARIRDICKKENFSRAVVGMEPTGHYWKALANWLEKQEGIRVVLVNPYATKQAKELDDNSQTKSDKKDAMTIAKLVKDGRYFELYLPHDIYAELRGLSTTRTGLNKRKNAVKNTITAVMDEYFPEYGEVFKCPLSGKASRHILKTCPFPKFILELGEDAITDEIKKAVKKTVGRKKAVQLTEAAKDSVGVDYGEEAARLKLRLMLEELELLEKQKEELERQMADALQKTDYAEFLLSIKGIGVVTLAACLGELGDPARFDSPRQMSRMAGYNLVEDSSGKNKSGTKISKRGRKNLRSVLYQMALTMVATNDEMKQLYHYLKTREKAPLRKMQALIVVSKKILTLIYTLAKKKENYDPEKVFGHVRREQLKAVA